MKTPELPNDPERGPEVEEEEKDWMTPFVVLVVILGTIGFVHSARSRWFTPKPTITQIETQAPSQSLTTTNTTR